MKTIFLTSLLIVLSATLFGQENNAPTKVEIEPISDKQYNNDWAEIDKRPLPGWFNKAKFGIFVVWGPYSVPSYAPVGPNGYAEWYWARLLNGDKSVEKFHKKVYGDTKVEDLIHDFTADFFDADEWCDLFEKSGAKYVVTTANYHDGFAMYPTEYSETQSTKEWNSMVVGPKRDVIGELNDAGNKLGLKMGIYYSLYEWYHPLWLSNRDKFVTEQFHPKLKEVVTKYKPWSIFFDGDWAMSGKKWRNNELAKWLYNESPVKDHVVVNDRWGSSRGINGDVFESEYGYGKWTSPEHPWQEDRGIGQSYGYNREENINDYNSADELIEQLCLVTAGGGNFLLCVGPTADGRIPVIMQERLLEIGDWLKVNGDAIYDAGSNPFWPRTFDWGTITSKTDTLYAHVFNPKINKITIDGFSGKVTEAYFIGENGKQPIKYKSKKGMLKLQWSNEVHLSSVSVITLVTEGECTYDKIQRQSKNGELFLTARAFSFSNSEIKPMYGGFRDRMKVVNWNNRDDFATANVIISEPGKYKVSLTYMATANNQTGSELELSFANKTFQHTTILCKENEDFIFEPKTLGEVQIGKPGRYTIIIKPKKEGVWNGLGLQSFKIEKIK
ncbi:alpha-L-fucosidase [Lutibacter citreus]|uniref:alpha-L-fucosidase n=1 Tax=Lutibacter citreus TaxID=2138210 RepID=UPI000DBE7AD0|nr:alpha-L-fucosidase [Lutibacter citreus]